MASVETCIGYVTYPDGSTGPGCPDEPEYVVETLCTGGDRFDGPVCIGHMKAVFLTVPLDRDGHRVLLLRSRMVDSDVWISHQPTVG